MRWPFPPSMKSQKNDTLRFNQPERFPPTACTCPSRVATWPAYRSCFAIRSDTKKTVGAEVRSIWNSPNWTHHCGIKDDGNHPISTHFRQYNKSPKPTVNKRAACIWDQTVGAVFFHRLPLTEYEPGRLQHFSYTSPSLNSHTCRPTPLQRRRIGKHRRREKLFFYEIEGTLPGGEACVLL